MWIYYNPNPVGRSTGDCSVRAVAKALGLSWEDAFWEMCEHGYLMGDMPSGDSVWGAVLREHGFKRASVPDKCPECYTVEDFIRDNPQGVFVLGFGGHVATVIDGDLYDSWDSSMEVPVYVWYKNRR